MAQKTKKYIIYIDSGGTFTDALVVKPDGSFVSGKAESDPRDFVGSFFNCIKAATLRIGLPLEEVIANCDEIGYGTTAGTNIIVTGVGGPKLGLITTKGIEDRTFMWPAKGSWYINARCYAYDCRGSSYPSHSEVPGKGCHRAYRL